MPELPEVETTCRGIAPHIEGKRIAQVVVRDHRLRWPIPEALPRLLKNRTLLEVSRRGKYIILRFSHGHALVHLGMSGNLRIVEIDTPPAKHDHIDLVFGRSCILRLCDPRRFGAFLWTDEAVSEHKLIAHLGPEPLSDDFTDEVLFKASRKRKVAVKSFVMDSKVVVGVGNIYANEALFMAGIRPTKAAGSLSRAACISLSEHIRTVLAKAIEQGGTTLKDFVGGDGKPGYFKQELKVYGRGGEPCVNCAKPLKEIQLGARATVYCTACQG